AAHAYPVPRAGRAACGRPRLALAIPRAPPAHRRAGSRAAAGVVRRCQRRPSRAARTPAQSHRPPRRTATRMSTEDSDSILVLHQALAAELARVFVGAQEAIRALTVALIARGHVLVQGVPGLGKTLLAKSLARALGGEFKRIQGTPDLMPSDIT